jgi:hypothetical protein
MNTPFDEKIEEYKKEVQIMLDRGVRNIRYDFVEGSTAEQRLDSALEVVKAINSGDFESETLFEGTVGEALFKIRDGHFPK